MFCCKGEPVFLGTPCPKECEDPAGNKEPEPCPAEPEPEPEPTNQRPTFHGQVVPQQAWVVDEEIERFWLPAAGSGTGKVVYTLTPDLPSGLNLDKRKVSGVPVDELAETQYTWTATDEDDRSAFLTFDVRVDVPTPPPVPVPATPAVAALLLGFMLAGIGLSRRRA